jgi:hypothetical protein
MRRGPRGRCSSFHVLMFKVDAVPVGVLPVAQNGPFQAANPALMS